MTNRNRSAYRPGDADRMVQNALRALPAKVLARWQAKDWDEETMTASEYRYYAVDEATGYAGTEIALRDEDLARYSWGPAHDNPAGGSQLGVRRTEEAGR